MEPTMRPTSACLLLVVGLGLIIAASTAEARKPVARFNRHVTSRRAPGLGAQGAASRRQRAVALVVRGAIRSRVEACSPVARAICAPPTRPKLHASWDGQQGKLPLQLAASLQAGGGPELRARPGLRADRTDRTDRRGQERAALEAARREAVAHLQALMKVINEQVALGTLETSRELGWTRDLSASPGSRCGLAELGEVFKEKRAAVKNLDRAEQSVHLLRGHVEALGRLAEAAGSKALSRARLLATLDTKLRQIRRARGELRSATRTIWQHRWIVTIGASPERFDALKAMFER